MGRTREQTENTGSEEELAAIGLALASGVATPAPLALLLMPLLPAGLSVNPQQRVRVTQIVAELLLSMGALRFSYDNDIERDAALMVLAYRAAYARAALMRIARAAVDNPESLQQAAERERPYLQAHEDASRWRLAGARAVGALVELHGPMLGWYHGKTRTPEEPRPTHLASNGKNFDARRGPPVFTGAYPGVLPWCSCIAGPPHRGGSTIV